MNVTTTPAATQEPGASAQPDEQPAEAVPTTPSEPISTDQPEPSTDEPAPAENSDDDVTDWASKKGIDLSTPEGQAKALKSWREAEKTMHASTQKASELQKQIGLTPVEEKSADPMVQEALTRASNAETTVKVSQWKAENGITAQQDAEMGKYIESNPDKGWMLKNGYLSLDDVAAMSGVNKVDAAQAEKQGGQKALEKLANKQRAVTVNGSATNPNVTTSDDPIMAALLKDD